MNAYQNPILPGFYPDPSICRAGEDYYLVNSSFEFFPGVPLWHSRDLVHWERQGSVLTRKSQLDLVGAMTSVGIFAPTIREHGGRFYMITTNVLKFPTGRPNFIVHTDDINGPWSDPVWIDHMGIDPSLFWDDDGQAYYVGTGDDPESHSQGIVCFGIDPETGEIRTEKRVLWTGSGGRCPEGPHLYKIHGTYYLMIAEGGTEYGHMVTIARSDCLWGPYESCPHNPILTHRNADQSPLQGVGHADLVDTPDGRWFLVVHGVRPSRAQLHHIGRETLLAPVEWVDGWPVVNGGRPLELTMGEGEPARGDMNFAEDFSGETLDPRWTFLRNPVPEHYRLGGGLTLISGSGTLDDYGETTFLGVRQQQMELTFETELMVEGPGEAGLSVFHTNEHHYDLCVSRQEGGLGVSLRRRAVDLCAQSQPVVFPGEQLVLRVIARRGEYVFLAGPDAASLTPIGTGSTQLLSTEAMRGTFTGCFAALFAQHGATARFGRFSVTEDPEQRQLNTTLPAFAYPV